MTIRREKVFVKIGNKIPRRPCEEIFIFSFRRHRERRSPLLDGACANMKLHKQRGGVSVGFAKSLSFQSAAEYIFICDIISGSSLFWLSGLK